MGKPTELMPGTLDMLILKALSLEPLHGYGVLLRIGQISGHAFDVPQGSLYPALYRLEHQGLIEAEWGTSENSRKARFYHITRTGKKRLKDESESWSRFVAAVTLAMSTKANEA